MNILRNGQGVEKRRSTGKLGWEPGVVIAQYDFWDNEIEYACNDVVTLTPYLDKSGGRYGGVAMVGWYTGSGYTYGTVIDAPKKIIQFTMDQDRIAKLLFDTDDFLAVKVKIRTRDPYADLPTGGAAMYSFDITSEGKIADQLGWTHSQIEFEGVSSNQSVYPIVEFNKAVNTSTLDASSDNTGLWARDQQREDHNKERKYFTTQADNPASIRIKCVALDGLSAWCSGRLTIEWDGVIRSQDDETLINPYFETVAIAPPLVTVRIDMLEVLDDSGWDIPSWIFFIEDDPEVQVITSTGMISTSMYGVDYSETGDVDADGPYEGMGEGENQYPYKIVGKQPGFSPLASNGGLLLDFQVFDLDPSFPNLTEFLSSVAQGLSDVSIDTPDDYAAYIGYGLGFLSAFIADWLTEGAKPDFMADLTPHEPLTFGKDMFGGLPQTANSSSSKSQSSTLENDWFRIRYSILLEPR